jgi:hypothetical protein
MKLEILQFINFTFSQFVNSSRPQAKCINIEVWYTKRYTLFYTDGESLLP